MLISAIAAATIGGALAMRRAFPTWLKGELEAVFGPEIAKHSETARFIADITEMFENGPAPAAVPGLSEWTRQPARPAAILPSQIWNTAFFTELFARSTNAVRTDETGEALIYDQLFLPSEAACSNQLAIGSELG